MLSRSYDKLTDKLTSLSLEKRKGMVLKPREHAYALAYRVLAIAMYELQSKSASERNVIIRLFDDKKRCVATVSVELI